jgi:hypothetical protein
MFGNIGHLNDPSISFPNMGGMAISSHALSALFRIPSLGT